MSKINGITVGTPTPRSNYNQTDPKKADYIIGRENIATFIGYTMFVPDYGELPNEGELDVTETITYKPEFYQAEVSAFKPMFFVEKKIGMPEADGFTFHNYYTVWNFYGKSIDIYFHSYTTDGIRKKIRLHYQYTEEDTSAPQSITAYLTTENPIGDIETALDGIIAQQESIIAEQNSIIAIQEALIGGVSE